MRGTVWVGKLFDGKRLVVVGQRLELWPTGLLIRVVSDSFVTKGRRCSLWAPKGSRTGLQ